MKHNQKEEASHQNDKGTSQQKPMPKNQDGHGQEKSAQKGTDHGHSSQEDQNNQGSKKHSGAGKSK